jgi:dolichol-phosphate mannosyltransferase
VNAVSLKTAIIIPTYNERENLQDLVPQILTVLNASGVNGSIIVVDDSSPDGTGDLAKELSAKHGKIIVITRKAKLGIGSAYKDGFRTALSLGFECLIEMDADGSHNPRFIPAFVEKLEEGYELVIGSRYIPGGKIPDWPLTRRIISKTTGFVTRSLFGLKTRDPTSGFRAYHATALSSIDLSKVASDGYAFQVEMVALCEKRRFRVCEIPIEFVDRWVGKSKLSGMEYLRFMKAVLRLAFTM